MICCTCESRWVGRRRLCAPSRWSAGGVRPHPPRTQRPRAAPDCTAGLHTDAGPEKWGHMRPGSAAGSSRTVHIQISAQECTHRTPRGRGKRTTEAARRGGERAQGQWNRETVVIPRRTNGSKNRRSEALWLLGGGDSRTPQRMHASAHPHTHTTHPVCTCNAS